MEEMEKSIIGYINPKFPIKVKLACLSDGEKNTVVDICGSGEELITAYGAITEGLIKVFKKDQDSKDVLEIVTKVATIALRKALGEDEYKKAVEALLDEELI